MDINAGVLNALRTLSERPVSVVDFTPLGGGTINQSGIVRVRGGARYFVKYRDGASSYPGMFEVEHLALRRIAQTGTIRVPTTLTANEHCIVQEVFERGRPNAGWHATIGRQLAQLHSATKSTRFGFDKDGYIGTTPQLNTWCNEWTEFWRNYRIGKQLEWLVNIVASDDELMRALRTLCGRLEHYLGAVDEPAVLVHGDLWSGNAAADGAGEPIIFDPAGYYASREVELGMMRLFGGFGPVTEAAYNEVWPLAPGSEARIALYRLYHEVNHMLIFGRSYYQSALTTARSLL